ncbi:MAG: ankyrin repeat domain-containing protein [Verrucomicrobia bacterium]|nr:ankyrin repeat domain-containing protein [Verrucomicrobiota bacterium]
MKPHESKNRIKHSPSLPLTDPRLGFPMRARPHRHFLTIINRGLLRALPAVLMLGVSAVAMAAEIHDAVRAGDVAAVARLLKKDAKLVNLADEDHAATPLHLAVDAGNLELVKVLLEAGATVTLKMDDGNTPLWRAAAITNHQGYTGLLKVLEPLSNSSPGRAAAESRETLKAYRKSLVPDPEEEAARLAVLRLLVERDRSLLNKNPTLLHVAAVFGNRKAVEYLLAQGADLEATATGFRPLHYAAQMGNSEVVKVLLEHRAAVNAAHVPLGTRPLHSAIPSGDVETIRLLLDHGAEVNAVNMHGAPALLAATWSDEIFDLLLERGANPKLQQSDGTTTLHRACHDGSKALVVKLLQFHPDLEAWDSSYYTPLLNAAEVGRVDLLKLLVAAGADLKATQQDGRNALYLAAGSECPEAVQFLLDQKLGVNALSDFGGTALTNAAGAGRLESVTLLLRAGATVNGADRRKGMTALMCAACGIRAPHPLGDRLVREPGATADYQKIVALLLDAGADVRAKDSEGKTALHWATAAGGNPEVLELLISKGAQVDAKDKSGQTPLHHAANTADVKTVAALLAKGANISARDAIECQPIHIAARGNNLAVLEFLIAKGADVAATESHGGTPLHLAAMFGKPEAARVLLACGAPPGALDPYKNSPLHYAALNGTVEVVRLLLEHRVPVDVANSLGNTPLHHAAIVRVDRAGFAAIAGQPENAQAGIDAINKSNPADKLEIVKLLLKNGARPDVKNKQGITPIDFAGKLGTPDILAALKTHKPSTPGK